MLVDPFPFLLTLNFWHPFPAPSFCSGQDAELIPVMGLVFSGCNPGHFSFSLSLNQQLHMLFLGVERESWMGQGRKVEVQM